MLNKLLCKLWGHGKTYPMSVINVGEKMMINKILCWLRGKHEFEPWIVITKFCGIETGRRRELECKHCGVRK